MTTGIKGSIRLCMVRLLFFLTGVIACVWVWDSIWKINKGVVVVNQPSIWGNTACARKSVVEERSKISELGIGLTVKEALSGNSSIFHSLDCRFLQRRKRLQQYCAKNVVRPLSKNVVKPLQYGQGEQCLLYKIGSMFWKGYNEVYENAIKNNTGDAASIAGEPIKFVFVRDPYSRLLSGYVDKIFSPNPIYWKSYGVRALLNSRPDVKNVQCGYDVTFAEFVDYILMLHERNRTIDNHFVPIQNVCYFCQNEHNIVGKMETFMDDMLYISDKLGSLKIKATREYILKSKNATEFMIHKKLYNVFHHRKADIERCGVNLREAMQFTWRNWQIRGFIEPTFPFPFKQSDKNITWQLFEKEAMYAREWSDKRKLSEAKTTALREAYSTLTVETKHKLKNMFLPQFDMFGYDPMPDYVFGKYSPTTSGFSFFEKKSILNFAIH